MVTFDRLVDNGTPCSYEKTNYICIDGKCEVCGYNSIVCFFCYCCCVRARVRASVRACLHVCVCVCCTFGVRIVRSQRLAFSNLSHKFRLKILANIGPGLPFPECLSLNATKPSPVLISSFIIKKSKSKDKNT